MYLYIVIIIINPEMDVSLQRELANLSLLKAMTRVIRNTLRETASLRQRYANAST